MAAFMWFEMAAESGLETAVRARDALLEQLQLSPGDLELVRRNIAQWRQQHGIPSSGDSQ